MSKKRYSVFVRGRRKEWSFDFMADPKYVDEWRADGLHIDEVLNIIPAWWVNYGLPLRLWYFLQNWLGIGW